MPRTRPGTRRIWKNPRFNELLVAARAETDDKKRAEMYAEMQQLLHDDGGVIVLVFNNYVERALEEARARRGRRQSGRSMG